MPVIVYSALRLLLLGAAIGALLLAGMRGWLLVVVGAFAAWALSYVLLVRQRDRAATWIADRAARRRASGERISAAVDADAAAEDEEVRALTLGDTSEREPHPEQDAVGEPER